MGALFFFFFFNVGTGLETVVMSTSTSILLHFVSWPCLHSKGLESTILKVFSEKMKLIGATEVGLLCKSLLIYN